eukprot:scaffold7879_cov103-Isochrysis_galbana.AAC.4
MAGRRSWEASIVKGGACALGFVRVPGPLRIRLICIRLPASPDRVRLYNRQRANRESPEVGTPAWP